jgi:hypothetical protein
LHYALGKNLRDSQQLLLARLPPAPTNTVTVPGVIPLLSPVVTSEASLEQHVYVFLDIFGIILLDDLLQSRSVVANLLLRETSEGAVVFNGCSTPSK